MSNTLDNGAEAAELEISHVVLACDESGAKGYADLTDTVTDEIGVFAGIMVPAEKLAMAQPEFDQLVVNYASPNGKLHIADLNKEEQEALRNEVYQLVRKHELPVFYEAIHVAGYNQAHRAFVEQVEKAQQERTATVKVSSNSARAPSLHVEMFQGLYSKVIAFCMERNKRRLHIEVRTDRVDSPIAKEFNAAAQKLMDSGTTVKNVTGFDTNAKKVVRAVVTAGPAPDLDVTVDTFELKVSDDTDGLVVAADVLVNSLHYLFRNRTAEEKYRALNGPQAFKKHPLRDCLDSYCGWGSYNFTDTHYRHPSDPALAGSERETFDGEDIQSRIAQVNTELAEENKAGGGSISSSVGETAGAGSATAAGQAVHDGTGASLGPVTTVTATLDVRRNLSVQMLAAARNAARRVYEIEEANKQAKLGPWFDDILIDVPIAVVMSAASIEACANEMIKNLLDSPKTYNLSEARILLLTDLLERRVGQPREKFEQVGLYLDRRLDTGLYQWDDLRLLQSLRSVFMHFKPIWDSEQIPSEKAFRSILRRVGGVCRFFPKEYPYAAFSYRVARWGVSTVPAFTAHFSAQLGIGDILGGRDFSLPEPPPS